MGKFDGVLLASDFDNTLIYTENALLGRAPMPPLSRGNREALEYFMAGGGRFSIATGRALAAFSQYAGDIPMNAPGVICNGAAIYDFAAQKYLDFALLDETALRRGQAALDAFPSVGCEAYHIDNVIHAVHPNAVTRRHQHITHVGVVELPSLAEVPLPLGKLLFEEDRAVLERLVAFMETQGWAQDYEMIFSGQYMMEMTRRGANKGGMIRRLAQLESIAPENLYCVGDEANDLPMLRAAAEGFAPANCIDAVRVSGATIVADAREDAVADVIARLDKRY